MKTPPTLSTRCTWRTPAACRACAPTLLRTARRRPNRLRPWPIPPPHRRGARSGSATARPRRAGGLRAPFRETHRSRAPVRASPRAEAGMAVPQPISSNAPIRVVARNRRMIARRQASRRSAGPWASKCSGSRRGCRNARPGSGQHRAEGRRGDAREDEGSAPDRREENQAGIVGGVHRAHHRRLAPAALAVSGPDTEGCRDVRKRLAKAVRCLHTPVHDA